MATEALKEEIKRELPIILREDPQFREYFLNIARMEFAPKKDTQDRFYEILANMERNREEEARKWDEFRAWMKEQKEQWRKHQEWVKAQDKKWEDQKKKDDEFRELMEEQKEQWRKHQHEHQEWVKAQDKKWEEQKKKDEEEARKWDEFRALMEEQKEQWREHQKWVKAQDKKWNEHERICQETQERNNRKFEKFMEQINRHDRTIGALGARWGIMSERSFRNALAGILEDHFDVEVINVNEYDDKGEVFGRPEQIELDVIIKNGMLLICELKSSIDKGGMYLFERKARFYEKRHNRKADRLMVISPMIEAKAQKVADSLGIETFTDSLQVKSL